MARQQNTIRAIAILYVLEEGGTADYDDMINIMSSFVDDEQAYYFRMRKLRLQPNETTAETVQKGKIGIARFWAAQAFTKNRLKVTKRNHNDRRIVCLGEPPTHIKPEGSGPDQDFNDWEPYHRYLKANYYHYLHPLSANPTDE